MTRTNAKIKKGLLEIRLEEAFHIGHGSMVTLDGSVQVLVLV